MIGLLCRYVWSGLKQTYLTRANSKHIYTLCSDPALYYSALSLALTLAHAALLTTALSTLALPGFLSLIRISCNSYPCSLISVPYTLLLTSLFPWVLSLKPWFLPLISLLMPWFGQPPVPAPALFTPSSFLSIFPRVIFFLPIFSPDFWSFYSVSSHFLSCVCFIFTSKYQTSYSSVFTSVYLYTRFFN